VGIEHRYADRSALASQGHSAVYLGGSLAEPFDQLAVDLAEIVLGSAVDAVPTAEGHRHLVFRQEPEFDQIRAESAPVAAFGRFGGLQLLRIEQSFSHELLSKALAHFNGSTAGETYR
jgi:hypothetical protein